MSQADPTAPVAAVPERRLAAILHADMVGYSRLTELDEAGTLAALRAIREGLAAPLIAAGGGRIVGTAGDSILAVFTSVTAAVRCAVALQAALAARPAAVPDRAIRYRIGIDLDDVVADGTDVLGQGVNVAARLQAICPPGRVCVSRAVHDRVRDRAEFRLEPLGSHALKNIARPVEAFLVQAPEQALPRWRRLPRRLPGRRAAGVALALLACLLLYLPPLSVRHDGLVQDAAALPDLSVARAPRLSLVVLPFGNLGGDPAQDYLADAVTEDLTTDLARLRNALVIARGSAFSYPRQGVDVRAAGNQLGVRYVVQGSIRRHGDLVRVNARLASTETGTELWAERFDQEVSDLARGQDDIVRRIALALRTELIAAEGQRSLRERPTNPDAHDLVMRARALVLRGVTRQRAEEAIALYEQALALDPASVAALTGLGELLIFEWVGLNDGRPAAFRRARELLAVAERVDPDAEEVLNLRAFVLRAEGRYEEAIVAYQRLIAVNPNAAAAYGQIAVCHLQTGRPEPAVPLLREAIRRDPRDWLVWTRYQRMGEALLRLRQPQDAIIWLQRGIEENPAREERSSLVGRFYLASALGHAGRMPEARRALARALEMSPFMTARRYAPVPPGLSPYAAQQRYIADGLRVAGLRDHAGEDAPGPEAGDGGLRPDRFGVTPRTVPGARTIGTAELVRAMEEEAPLLLDLSPTGVALPGAVLLNWQPFHAGSLDDPVQDRLRRRMLTLTGGDMTRPVVVAGWNAEGVPAYNLVVRLLALGHADVRWYRDGKEIWEVRGLPETEGNAQEL